PPLPAGSRPVSTKQFFVSWFSTFLLGQAFGSAKEPYVIGVRIVTTRRKKASQSFVGNWFHVAGM
ncbi:MAG: hypothetical protein QF920_07475, partial [Verrucomicrobiota bacterium]|nr:hypothetical protein [Verrucomicrobiota bacterium]